MDFAQHESVDFKQIAIGGTVSENATVTLKQGEVLSAGSVLGQVTADKTYRLSVAASNDGSETIRPVVLMHDADATDGDLQVDVWIAEKFDPAMLVIGAGHDIDDVREAWIGTPMFAPAVRHP